MFDHKHYVPILKGKDAEFGAIKELSAEAKARLTPLIEIPPIPYDFENDQPAKSVDDHLEKVVEKLLACWMFHRPLFLDLLYIPESEAMEDGGHPLSYLFDNARKKQLKLIPVTALSRPDSYQAVVKEVIATDKLGVCVRVEADSFEEILESKGKLGELLAFLGVTPKKTDLILDFKEIATAHVPTTVIAAAQIMKGLPHVNDWRTITLAGSAFPQSLMKVKPNVPHKFTRAEWQVWETFASGRKKVPRLPTFGDYSINHPEPSEVDPRLMMMTANLRYTIEQEWLIFKGRSVKFHGYEQFHDLCAAVIAHPEYRGPDFSRGDKQISECAGRAVSPGNATTWRKIGFNHHMTLVTKQIASLT